MYDTLRIRTYRCAVAPKSAESRTRLLRQQRGCRRCCSGRVAKNCCVSISRKQNKFRTETPAVANSKLSTLNSPLSPEMLLEAQDTQRLLSEAIALLKPRERELFEMRQIEGLSTDEVVEQTGIPKPSVIAMVSAARKKVFTELKRRMKQ